MKASVLIFLAASCVLAADCAVAQYTIAPWIVNRTPTTTTTKRPWIFPNWLINRERAAIDDEKPTTTKRPQILELLTGKPLILQTLSPKNISRLTFRTIPPEFTLPTRELVTIRPITRRTLPPIYTRFTLPTRFTFPTRFTVPPRTIRPFTIPPWFDRNNGAIDPIP